MTSPEQLGNYLNRRSFLGSSGIGVGSAALFSLLGRDALGRKIDTSYDGLPGLPHHDARIKRVIFLTMAGGPSHLETFDYKPKLDELNGQPMPESFTKGQPIAQLQGQKLKVQGHLTKFQEFGKGQFISDFLPYHRRMADQICVIKSMQTEQINHDPAHTFMNTGTAISGRPSMGAWINYGLGSDSEDLPGFVVMTSVGGRNPQPIAARQWGTGFLPSRHQGVEFNSTGDPVHYVTRPGGVSEKHQRALVQSIQQLDNHRNELVENPEIKARIAAYEMAFRMQASVPDLTDLSDEPQHVLDMYGARPGDGSFASNCLLARRLAEKGVRFIQLYHRGWDHHGGLVKYMNTCCGLTDKPTWALLTDLKQRGMLDDTLVFITGEFSRTPGNTYRGGGVALGRDHNPEAMSMLFAGGGTRAGEIIGATDELGAKAVECVHPIANVHCTILHAMGLDDNKLTYFHGGRHKQLSQVGGSVIHELLT